MTCALTCPSKICYPSISKINKYRGGEFKCSQTLKYRELHGMVDFDLDRLAALGFTRFKMLRAKPSDIAGVKGVDPVLIRAGQVLGCRDETTLFRKVIFPAALPHIVVGLRISFGTGWAAIIAAELVAAQSGLGYLIADGMEILRSDLVLVGMAVIGILGVMFDSMFRFLHRRYGWAA